MRDSEILQMSLKEAWKAMTGVMNEEDQEIYDKVRFGLETQFDIYHYIEDFIKIKPKTGKVIIQGKTLNLTEYWTELEMRKKIATDYLLDTIGDKELGSRRQPHGQ